LASRRAVYAEPAEPRSRASVATRVSLVPSDEWDAPFPFGYPAAVESAGSVAAPLLAGFSFALVGLIIPSPEHFRWPSGALILLLGGGIFFIAAVQCSFWARQFVVTPQEFEEWRPEYPPERKHALQHLHRRGFTLWAARFNFCYRAGILLLLAGVVVAVIPPGTIGCWVSFGARLGSCHVAPPRESGHGLQRSAG
jgi:hypothetical protein